MELWEYVFEADQRLDLAAPDAGRDWLSSQPWGIRSPGAGWWTPKAVELWPHNINVLRSLAETLQGKRPKRLSNLHPGTVWGYLRDDLVGNFRVALNRTQARDGNDLALTPKSFLGLGIVPSATNASGNRHGERPYPQMYWRDDCDFLWQVVFLSILTNIGQAVCERCGALLGETTKTGRKKKQRACGKCRYKAWWAKQSQKTKRTKWKKDNKNRKRKEND